MKDDQHRFLALLGQLPVRLTAEQAGWVLNCQPHDIPALIHARLLKPLGNPAQNGAKYFATADVLETAKDRTGSLFEENSTRKNVPKIDQCHPKRPETDVPIPSRTMVKFTAGKEMRT